MLVQRPAHPKVVTRRPGSFSISAYVLMSTR